MFPGPKGWLKSKLELLIGFRDVQDMWPAHWQPWLGAREGADGGASCGHILERAKAEYVSHLCFASLPMSHGNGLWLSGEAAERQGDKGQWREKGCKHPPAFALWRRELGCLSAQSQRGHEKEAL